MTKAEANRFMAALDAYLDAREATAVAVTNATGRARVTARAKLSHVVRRLAGAPDIAATKTAVGLFLNPRKEPES
jgi:hypothetical protein